MVNKSLFGSGSASSVPMADVKNEAGGRAYKMEDKHAVAQYVATSCLNGTFHSSAQAQLDEVVKLLGGCEPEFIGKVAVYGRQSAFMKDLPALLCAHLASDNGGGKGPTTEKQEARMAVLRKVFPHVIDSGVMLRNFVQIIRSGTLGRKSFGECPRGLICKWFEDRSPASIFHQSIGQNPSMGDVIKMARPKPNTPEKAALFSYLCGAKVVEEEGRRLRTYYLDKKDGEVKVAYEHLFDNLPQIVRDYEAWKADKNLPMPKLNFRFLDGVGKLSTDQWTEIARNANWLTTLKNLNAYQDHGVFGQDGLIDLIYQRLGNAEEIAKVRVFPYQILVAYLASDGKVPAKVRDALHDALEAATKNVPVLPGKVFVCPDVSGSMSSGRVTGERQKGRDSTGTEWDTSTKARCIEVAALFAASILRVNRDAEVIPFEQAIRQIPLEPRDTVMTNAKKLASIGGGGTNCSAPLAELNRRGAKGDMVVFISDYESWVDSAYAAKGTAMMEEWQKFKNRNPKAKLVCIDLTPRSNAQVKEREDILQVGGFSDNVFTVVAQFAKGGWDKDFWLHEIEKIDLDNLQ